MTPLESLLEELRHPAVRECAWAVGAPPLMTQVSQWDFTVLDEEWFDRELLERWDWFMALDADPSPLLARLEGASHLLGKRFETLLQFYFEAHPSWQILQAGWPVQDPASGATAGEFDFILKDLRTGRTLHLEVACKFYLAAANASTWAVFKGPNARDTLVGKMDKLLDQIHFSSHPAAAQALSSARIRIDDRALLLKGGLFHHLSTVRNAARPRHAHRRYLTGWWIHRSEWPQLLGRGGNVVVVQLPKAAWLGGRSSDVLNAPPDRPTHCARMLAHDPDPANWIELDRGFIVPDSWPEIPRQARPLQQK